MESITNEISSYIRDTHLAVRVGLVINGTCLPNDYFPVYMKSTYEFQMEDGNIDWEIPPLFLLDKDHKPDYSSKF